jgi:ribonuclease E
VNNTTIINKTVNVTKIKVVNNIVINEGPNTTVIEKASGRRIEAVPAREMRRKLEAPVVEHERQRGHVVETKPAPPQEKAPEPREVRESRPPREVPERREAVTPPAREPRPVVGKDTQAPAAPVNPVVRAPAERERKDNVTATRPAPPKPKELKKEPRPTPAPERPAVGSRQERTVTERSAQPVERPAEADVHSDKEKPIKGRGADKQMKAAQETRQNKAPGKSAEKGKKKKETEKPENQNQPVAPPP